MKVVFIKNNDNFKYENIKLDGYKFIPRRKNINSLIIINFYLIKKILHKRITKDIKKVDKTIMLIIKSNVTLLEDCDMMENELIRIINNINNKYIKYFNEFEYFDFIKSIYILHNVILLKKNLVMKEYNENSYI